MKSAHVLAHEVPSKQLCAQLQAQVQGRGTLCMVNGRALVVPRL
jgi:hypothetical protein